MLNENIKTIRKSKGLSQEELAHKLSVVRQTISKWENGLSVFDSDMLITISEVLETPVSILLGETITALDGDDLKLMAEKIEEINLQLDQRKITIRKMLYGSFIFLSLITVVIFTAFILINGSYLDWDYTEPEIAVAGTILHGFEWLFIRLMPMILVGTMVAITMMRKKDNSIVCHGKNN